MAESKPSWVNVRVEGEKVVVKTGGRTVVVEEKGAPRKRKEKTSKSPKDLKFPEGAIESLMPQLRVPYMDRGVSHEEGYWGEVDSRATLSPEEAAHKLKKAGVGHEEAARVLVSRDQQVQRSKAFGDFSESDVRALESAVAEHLRPLFAPVPPKRK